MPPRALVRAPRGAGSPALALLVAGFLAAATPATPAPPPRLALAPCRVAGLVEPARCGTLEVFENRRAAKGRKIGLRVVVVPAAEPPALPDAFVYIAGGPGDNSVAGAGLLVETYPELHRKRDFLLIDQRGTGGSAGLFCDAGASRQSVQSFLDDFLPLAMVRDCRQRLERRADLAQYTTEAAVDDLDEVRRALGYASLDLLGASYGTRVAQIYLRRHPQSARTAVLLGTHPIDARVPVDIARDAQAALDATWAACAGDPGCRRAFPDPRGDLAKVLARLERAPVRVALRDPQAGAPAALRLSRSGFAQTVRYMLYRPTTAVQIPFAVHAAAGGDFSPVAEAAQLFGRFLTSTADGLYLSVTCAEDVPFVRPGEAEAAARGTFLGNFRWQSQSTACAAWRAARLPKSFLEPARADVPTLLLSGERDPVTPAAGAERVARALPRSRHLVVPNGAHEFSGIRNAACLDRIVAAFVEAGSLAQLDVSCMSTLARPPFQLERPRRWRSPPPTRSGG